MYVYTTYSHFPLQQEQTAALIYILKDVNPHYGYKQDIIKEHLDNIWNVSLEL